MLPSLAFFIAAVVLAVTPGPGIAYVVARTAAGGRAEGLACCVGTGIGGLLTWARPPSACRCCWHSRQRPSRSSRTRRGLPGLSRRLLAYVEVSSRHGADRLDRRAPRLARGDLVETLNVKTALFFLAFLPQFLVSGLSVAIQLAVMGSVCVVLNTAVDVAAVYGAARVLGSEASGRRRAKVVHQVSGLALVGLGLYVAATRRGAP